MVRRRRPARHHRVAVPRDPAPAGQAPLELTDPVNRSAAVEAVATGLGGGVLGGAALAAFGLGWPGVAIGAANGALGGWRGTYAWRRPTGWLAFALDSTWAAPLTAAALFTHAVAAAPTATRRLRRRPQPAGQPPRLPARLPAAARVPHHDRQRRQRRRRPRRHRCPPPPGRHRSRGRPRLAGPLVRPAATRSSTAAGRCSAERSAPSCGPCAAATSRSAKVVETCAYYLNPFEWWAYSRDGHWPPRGKVAGLGWRQPVVRPLSRRAAAQPSSWPARPAAPG